MALSGAESDPCRLDGRAPASSSSPSSAVESSAPSRGLRVPPARTAATGSDWLASRSRSVVVWADVCRLCDGVEDELDCAKLESELSDDEPAMSDPPFSDANRLRAAEDVLFVQLDVVVVEGDESVALVGGVANLAPVV